MSCAQKKLTPSFLNLSCVFNKAVSRSLGERKKCNEQKRDKDEGECFVHDNGVMSLLLIS